MLMSCEVCMHLQRIENFPGVPISERALSHTDTLRIVEHCEQGITAEQVKITCMRITHRPQMQELNISFVSCSFQKTRMPHAKEFVMYDPVCLHAQMLQPPEIQKGI